MIQGCHLSFRRSLGPLCENHEGQAVSHSYQGGPPPGLHATPSPFPFFIIVLLDIFKYVYINFWKWSR
jgi:hypothetical protein